MSGGRGGGGSKNGGGGGSKNGGGGGSKNGAGGGGSIPVVCRKMVESLKEIVNCPELEIYAMLKECNMDPDDAVHRLLSQDTFHEVKSKRERRKEMKDTQETRSRGIISGSNCSIKGGGSERYVGRNGQNQISANELVKPAYKRENGSVGPSLSSFSSAQTAGKTMNQLPQSFSNYVNATNKGHSMGTGDTISSSTQPSAGFKSSWSIAPGHVSMADIVRMGCLQSKASSTPIMSSETSYLSYDTVTPNSSHDRVKHPHISVPLLAESNQDSHSQNPVSNVAEMSNEHSITDGHHAFNEEWPVIEQPMAASGSSVIDASASLTSDAEIYSYRSNLHGIRANLSHNSQPDEGDISEEDVAFKILNTERNGLASASSRQIVVDGAGGASHFDNDSHQDISSYQSHRHTFENQEVVSSATANFQRLSLGKEDMMVPSTEDNHAVMIPNHLVVSAADCSHLSFGTFKSGTVSGFSGSPASKHLEEVSPAAIDGSSVAHLDTRIPEHHGDEQLRSTSAAHRMTADAQTYDSLVSSRAEFMKQVTSGATHVHHDTFPSSVPGYDTDNRQQPGSASSFAQSNPQIRDLQTFPSGMQAYSNSPPSNLLASTAQSLRESDLSYSPLLMAQSMPSRYSSAVSSGSTPTISISEVLKPGSFSVPQPTSLSLTGTSIATGPALPQNFSVHSLSQPSLPLDHAANMMGYPFMPQNYGYLPSNFQQAYPGGSAFHQSLAALESAGLKYTLPQYRSSASLSGLPQSAANASGYGSFGSSTNNPGNFLQNLPNATTGTTIGYDDLLSSLYRDESNFIPLQQNENSATSVYGPGSRTLPNISASTYYGMQGQNQQHAGYGQGQHSSQHYGAAGYSNYLHSQTGVIQEHQQQSPSNTPFSVQDPSSRQSHQTWQHSY